MVYKDTQITPKGQGIQRNSLPLFSAPPFSCGIKVSVIRGDVFGFGLIRILMWWVGEDGERGFVDVRDSGEVEGDSVEKEVGVSGSIVDADKALEILVESLRLGVALPAIEVSQNWGGI